VCFVVTKLFRILEQEQQEEEEEQEQEQEQQQQQRYICDDHIASDVMMNH
jgi:hypothetical protein